MVTTRKIKKGVFEMWLVVMNGREVGTLSRARTTRTTKDTYSAYKGIGSDATHVGNYWKKKDAITAVTS
jgi:hypothetical protein